MVWIILLIVVALIVVALIALYNRLVRYRNRVDNAWAQIEVQLKRRWDLIPNLIETVRGYAQHERGTFEAVTEARAAAQTAQGPAATAAAEGILGQALGRLFAVAEAYPELQADENFRQLQTELSETENRIAVSRQVYNDTVLTYNNSIQTFPGLRSQGRSGSRSGSSSRPTRRSASHRGSTSPPAPARPLRPCLPPRPPSPTPAARAPVARPRGALALAATVVAALTLTGVAPGRDRRLVSSDVTATVRADGSVAVDEAITVAFSGSFTYGYREIPYRSGERIDEIGVSGTASPSGRARRPISSQAARPARSASMTSAAACGSSGGSSRTASSSARSSCTTA